MGRLHSILKQILMLLTMLVFSGLFALTALADRSYIVSQISSTGAMTNSFIEAGGSVDPGEIWDRDECTGINGHAAILPKLADTANTVYLGVLVNDQFCCVKTVPLRSRRYDGDDYDVIYKSDASFTFAGVTFTSSSGWKWGQTPSAERITGTVEVDEDLGTQYFSIGSDPRGRCYIIPSGNQGRFYTVQRIAYDSNGVLITHDAELVQYGGSASANSSFMSTDYTNVTERKIVYNGAYNAGTRNITWKDADGTVLHTQRFTKVAGTSGTGGYIPTYGGPSLNGKMDADKLYTLTGWSPEPSAGTGDAVYTAVYTEVPRQYLLTVKRQHRNYSIAEDEVYTVDSGSSVDVQLDTYIKNYKPQQTGTASVTVQGADKTYIVNYNNREIPLKIYLKVDGEYVPSETVRHDYVTWMGANYGIYYETEGGLDLIPKWSYGSNIGYFNETDAPEWLLGTSLDSLSKMMPHAYTSPDRTYTDQWYVRVEGEVDDLAEVYYAVPPNGEFYTITFNYPSDLADPNSEIISTSQVVRKGYSANPPVTAEGWGWDSDAYEKVSQTAAVNFVQGTSVTPPAAVTDLVYNGLEQTGVPAGEHYTLSGEKAVDAGTHTATATLEEGCFWTGGSPGPRTIRYTIGQKPVTITGAAVTKTYTGATFTVSGHSWSGVISGDGEVSGVEWNASGANKGTYTGTFTGTAAVVDPEGNDKTHNYSFTYTKGSLVIEAKDIAEAELTLSQNEYYAQNVARKPDVTVVVDGRTLTLSTDYTVAYTDNKDAGTATVTVTGKGNYTGTAQTTFTILPPTDLSAADITLSEEEYTWTGEAFTPSVTVVFDGATLTEDTDYTVTYADNTRAGTAKVTVNGIGAYAGTAEKTFTILKKDISDAAVTLTQTVFDYTALSIRPEISSVMLEGAALSSYSVSYENNRDVGTGRVLVNGTGNYGGTASAEFTIRSVRRAPEPDTGEEVEWAPYTVNKLEGGVSHIYLTQDISFNANYASYNYITNFDTLYLDLNGHTIYGNKNYQPLGIGSGKRVILSDSAGGGSIRPVEDNTTCNAVHVYSGGVFDMYGGTIEDYTISDGYNYGTVYVGEGGTFNMYGGAIRNNTHSGVRSGGGIYNYKGTVRIAGGEITGNQASYGGAVYTFKGNLYIQGGTISGNAATTSGGGVYCRKDYRSDAGVFEMTGGSITGNTAQQSGGGVHVDYSSFDMSGGEIASNTVSGRSSMSGGGIGTTTAEVILSGTAAVTDNVIEPTDSYAVIDGGGLSITNSSSLSVSGDAQITGNRIGLAGQFYNSVHKGAGIFNAGTLTMTGGTVSGNSGYTADGGGIYNMGTAHIGGGVITGNKAMKHPYYDKGGNGGAVYNDNVVTLLGGVTVTENTSEGGTAIGPKIPALAGALTGTIESGIAGEDMLKTAVSDGTYTLTEEDAGHFVSEDGKPGFLRSWDQCIYVGTESFYMITVTGNSQTAEYDGTEKAAEGYSIEGLEEGWTLTGLTWTASGTDAGSYEGAFEGTPVITDDAGTDMTLACKITLTEGSLEITQKSLAEAEVWVMDEEITYTGAPIEPELLVFLGDTDLIAGTDYTVTFENNTAAGSAGITVEGTGNYTGQAQGTFEIAQASIVNASLTVAQGPHIYAAKDIEPEVTVQLGAAVLAEGTDYTLIWSANKEAGTASVRAVGTGSCTGAVSGNFEIMPLDITEASIAVYSVTADGHPQTPAFEVSVGDVVLTEGIDYETSFADNAAPGTATVTVRGIGSCVGEASAEFTVEAAMLENASIAVGDAVYTGEPVMPEVTVTIGDWVLTEGENYTLTASDNTEAGTGTLTITGTGSCTGEVTKQFTILPRSLDGAVITAADAVYTSSAIIPETTIELNGTVLVEGMDYEISFSDNTAAGTAGITVTGIGNYTGTAEGSFVIKPQSVEGAVLTLGTSSYVYSGTPKQPNVLVRVNGKRLTAGTDYTLSYEDNIDAGSAQAVVTGKGNYTGSVRKAFTIKPQDLETAGAQVTISGTLQYNGEEQVPDVLVKIGETELIPGTDYELSASGNVNAGEGTYVVTGTGNYEGVLEGSFTIEPADLTDAVVKAAPAFYSGEAAETEVTVTLDGRILVNNTDYTITYENNLGAGTAVVSVQGTGNYTGAVQSSFEIIDPETLRTMKLPAALEEIGEEAFAGVPAERIVVPSGCRQIGDRAFAGCTALKVIELPSTVETIAEDAFEGTEDVIIAAPEGSSAAGWAEAHGMRWIKN